MITLHYDNELQQADFKQSRGNIVNADDEALETATFISLFTDKRADDDTPLPPNQDPRGWWGDSFPSVEGDEVGSLLWTLRQSGANALQRAVSYAKQALAWMITDGVAVAINASSRTVAPGLMLLEISIERPGNLGRWTRVWKVKYAV